MVLSGWVFHMVVYHDEICWVVLEDVGDMLGGLYTLDPAMLHVM